MDIQELKINILKIQTSEHSTSDKKKGIQLLTDEYSKQSNASNSISKTLVSSILNNLEK